MGLGLVELTFYDPINLTEQELREMEYEVEEAMITLRDLRDVLQDEMEQRRVW